MLYDLAQNVQLDQHQYHLVVGAVPGSCQQYSLGIPLGAHDEAQHTCVSHKKHFESNEMVTTGGHM